MTFLPRYRGYAAIVGQHELPVSARVMVSLIEHTPYTRTPGPRLPGLHSTIASTGIPSMQCDDESGTQDQQENGRDKAERGISLT
jgi:hypothetical protein